MGTASTLGDWAAALDGATALLNPRGPQRQLPVQRDEPRGDPRLARRLDALCSLRSDRALRDAAGRVAQQLDGDDLSATLEDRPQDEIAGEIGTGFSVGVARAWEDAFFSASVPTSVRRVALRTAMVMGRGAGGPFAVFHNLARLGLGGAMGPGTQRVSWLHVDDFVGILRFLISRDDLDGAINLSAPVAPTNADFMRTLRGAVGMPVGLPAPTPLLTLGAFFMRTETELPLKSRWVAPTRLRDAGYRFAFDAWSDAARALVAASS